MWISDAIMLAICALLVCSALGPASGFALSNSSNKTDISTTFPENSTTLKANDSLPAGPSVPLAGSNNASVSNVTAYTGNAGDLAATVSSGNTSTSPSNASILSGDKVTPSDVTRPSSEAPSLNSNKSALNGSITTLPEKTTPLTTTDIVAASSTTPALSENRTSASIESSTDKVKSVVSEEVSNTPKEPQNNTSTQPGVASTTHKPKEKFGISLTSLLRKFEKTKKNSQSDEESGEVQPSRQSRASEKAKDEDTSSESNEETDEDGSESVPKAKSSFNHQNSQENVTETDLNSSEEKENPLN